MTTIAYDGRHLAADGRASQGNLIVAKRTQKIFPLKVLRDGVEQDAVLAGAGSYQTLVQVKQALAAMEGIEAPEMIPAIEPGTFQGVLVMRGTGETFYLEDQLVLTEAELPLALGSGTDYALTAMRLGKNAEEAVHVACDLDCYSGGEIRVFDVASWDFLTAED